jgi:hypothetical protein
MTKNQVTSFCIAKKKQKPRDGFATRYKTSLTLLGICGTRADRHHCRAQTVLDTPGASAMFYPVPADVTTRLLHQKTQYNCE